MSGEGRSREKLDLDRGGHELMLEVRGDACVCVCERQKGVVRSHHMVMTITSMYVCKID